MTKPKTLYLSQQNLARVTAAAWLDDTFRKKVEKDPIPAIKKRFVNVDPPVFEDFDLLGIIAPRPDGITDDELRRVVSGEIIALPDRYMPPEGAHQATQSDAQSKHKKYLTQVEWCQVTALAWLEDDFKYALLRDPGRAIRSRQEFASFKFEYALWVPPPPEHLSEQQMKQIESGYQEAMVIPFFTFSDA
jgi:hypothetical protein